MEKLTGKTQDIVSDNVLKLKELFPEAFEEGKIDFDALKKVLGESVDGEKERYSFSWHGKSDAIKMALKQSTGTLRPQKADSKDWDTTKNLFLEGDNLEVLRILQNSYRGKVKMIYIDPPYNTGKDFIYSDNFGDNIKNYKEKVGDTMKANADSSGRYHTNWLNMMYPRLRLAKNLLKNDGVIFMSIDDNEVTNLRKVCDEIFGEDNFIADIAVVNNLKGRNDKKYIATAHERLLMYVKSYEFEESGLDLPEDRIAEFGEGDDIGKYRFLGLRKRGGADTREMRPRMFFPIFVNKKNGNVSLIKDVKFTEEVLPRKSDGVDGCWRWGFDTVKLRLDSLIAKKVGKEERYDVFEKDYLETNGEIRRLKPKSIMFGSNYSTDGATKAFKTLFPEADFNNPKPVPFLRDLLSYSTLKDGHDVVLDFFAGSSTTAHAVMQLNAEDGGNRNFVMVQIPESTPEDSEARKNGYKTIAEISKERIRRAGEQIIKEEKSKDGGLLKNNEVKKLDIGFRVFTLDETNFVEWDEETKDVKGELLKSLESIKQGRSQEDALYEILLKYGIDLAMPIQELDIFGKKVYSLADNYLLVCLEKDLSLDVIKQIAILKPSRVVFYDDGFKDDNIKANAEQTLKKNGVEDIRVI